MKKSAEYTLPHPSQDMMPTAELCSKASISERPVKGNHTFGQGFLQGTSLAYLCIFKPFDFRMGWKRIYDPLASHWLRAENFISVFTGVWEIIWPHLCESEDAPLPRQPRGPELQRQAPGASFYFSQSHFSHVTRHESVTWTPWAHGYVRSQSILDASTSKAKSRHLQSDARLWKSERVPSDGTLMLWFWYTREKQRIFKMLST